MDKDWQPDIIDLPVDPNQKDPDFQIQRMWLEATPYMPGNNCLFFAVQDALIHFNQKALSPDVLTEYKEEIKGIEDELRQSQPIKGAGIYSSLDMIARKLEPDGIVPEEILTAPEAVIAMRSFPVTERFDDKLRAIKPKEKVVFPFPCLIVTQRMEGGAHVFFASDKAVFYEKKSEHIAPGDNVAMLVKLHKVDNTAI